MIHEFDGQFPGNPGGEFLDPWLHDVSLTYALPRPEMGLALVDAYRTGRPVNFVQDVNALSAENVNWLNAAYNRNYRPAQRQSAGMVYSNVALIGVDLEGLR